MMARRAALIDGLVGEIYRASCRFADQQAPRGKQSGLAIVATGGYGRKELSPFSEGDIAFIPSEEQDPWVEAAVHAETLALFRDAAVRYALAGPIEVGGVQLENGYLAPGGSRHTLDMLGWDAGFGATGAADPDRTQGDRYRRPYHRGLPAQHGKASSGRNPT
jgi:hypothetical protein